MKLVRLLAIPAALAALAACGSGRPDGLVIFRGTPPTTALAKAKDNRTLKTYCPGCKAEIAFGTERCGDKRCQTQIQWKNKYPCWNCTGTGQCMAFVHMGQADGMCFNCKGSGILTFKGKTPDCPNCAGKKVCPVCEKSQKCDLCKGEKFVSAEVVKSKASRAAESGEEEPKTAAPAEDGKGQ